MPRRILILPFLLLAIGCSVSSHPSDEVLEDRFRAHRTEFEALVTMLNHDPDVIRITLKNVFLDTHSNRKLSEERIAEYRRLMRLLKLEGGIQRDRPGFILFTVSTKGLVIPNSGKSYLYSVTEPSPLVPSLDEVISNDRGDQKPVYKKLSDNWYLDYESW